MGLRSWFGWGAEGRGRRRIGGRRKGRRMADFRTIALALLLVIAAAVVQDVLSSSTCPGEAYSCFNRI
jgi:hypothetical protein